MNAVICPLMKEWKRKEGKMITLDQVERLMEETGAGYELSAWALKEAGGDMSLAKEYVEKARKIPVPNKEQEGKEKRSEGEKEDKITLDAIISTIRDAFHTLNATNLIVRKGEKEILNIASSLGAIGAIVLPQLALLGIGAAILTDYEIIVRLKDGREVNINRKVKDEAHNIKRSWDYYIDIHKED